MTTIVNVKEEKCDIYIGRPSLFGNPYKIGRDGTRDQVLSLYRKWFYERLNNPEFKNKVLLLKDKKLGCWCKPLSCHGDVIADYLNGL